MSRQTEKAPHLAIALRGAMVAVNSRRLFLAFAGSDPRGKISAEAKGGGGGAHFGDNLLCRIDSQAPPPAARLDLGTG